MQKSAQRVKIKGSGWRGGLTDLISKKVVKKQAGRKTRQLLKVAVGSDFGGFCL